MPLHPLALQTWTVRELLKWDTDKTLQRIRELGFEHLELAGTGSKSPQVFSSLCTRHGLKVMGTHQPPLTTGELNALVSEIVEHSEAFGSSFATVMLDPDERHDAEAYLRYADLCAEAGQRLARHQITLCYHCYRYDLEPLRGSHGSGSGLDVLLERTMPADLAFELDTYFLWKAGVTLEETLKKCGPRCRLVRLNDFSEDGSQAPLGDGVIPWNEWMDRLEETDSVEWLILEHDSPEPLDWIERSCSYWRSSIARE